MPNKHLRFEIFYQGSYTEFYPLTNNFGLGETLKYYNNYEDLPDFVYGKYLMGFAGYIPYWGYDTIKKQEISVMKNK